jgi:hypothetical protein
MMHYRKKLIIVRLFSRSILTGVFFSLSLVGASSETLESPEKSPVKMAPHPDTSLNSEPVDVKFGPSIYRIPRNYLAGVTQPNAKNEYAAFSIFVLLPDFTPRTPENAAELDKIGWHDQFRALFEYGRHPRSPEQVLEFYLKTAGMNKDGYRLVGSGYKLYESERTVPHEIYTKETPNGLLFFTCGNAKYGTPSPSCTVNEAFGDNVGVIYHFSRKYMDEAADIDLRLRDLLKGFLKK